MYIALGTTTIERTPMSNLKGIKKMIVATMAVGAIVGLSACNGDTTSASGGNNGSSSNSSKLTFPKGNDDLQKYLVPLYMDAVNAVDTAGGFEIAGRHLACYVEKNPQWGIKDAGIAIYRFAENNPNLDFDAFKQKADGLSRVIDAHYDDFHKWLNDARQYAISQDMNVIQERGVECLTYEYEANHPINF